MRLRTFFGDLGQQQGVFAHSLNWLEQVTAEIHAVFQLQLFRLSNIQLKFAQQQTLNRDFSCTTLRINA